MNRNTLFSDFNSIQSDLQLPSKHMNLNNAMPPALQNDKTNI